MKYGGEQDQMKYGGEYDCLKRRVKRGEGHEMVRTVLSAHRAMSPVTAAIKLEGDVDGRDGDKI